MMDSYLLGQWADAHDLEQNGEIAIDEDLGMGLLNLCATAEIVIEEEQLGDRSRIGLSQNPFASIYTHVLQCTNAWKRHSSYSSIYRTRINRGRKSYWRKN